MPEPVTCSRCGQSWPRDPALEVACPECLAPVGVRCRRPSGHGRELHHGRDRAAMAAGLLQPCPAGPSSNAGAGLPLFGGLDA